MGKMKSATVPYGTVPAEYHKQTTALRAQSRPYAGIRFLHEEQRGKLLKAVKTVPLAEGPEGIPPTVDQVANLEAVGKSTQMRRPAQEPATVRKLSKAALKKLLAAREDMRLQ